MKTSIFSLLFLCGGICAAPALADSHPADTISLQEILITAPHKTNVALTPLDVTVVNAEEIDRSTESSLLPVLMQKFRACLFPKEDLQATECREGQPAASTSVAWEEATRCSS